MAVKTTTLTQSAPSTALVATGKPPIEDTALTTVSNAGDYFESLETSDQDQGSTDESPAYVGLYTKKTNSEAVKNGMIEQKGHYDQFYIKKSGTIIPLNKFQYHLIDSFKAFTLMDGGGRNILDAKANDPGLKGWAEHGFAIILVKVGDDLIPATFTTARSGQYKCLKAAREMYNTAKDANKFAKLGEAFAVASTLKLPARFIATASASTQKSAESGYDFINGTCTTSPSKIEDGERFLSVTSKPEFVAELNAVLGVFKRKVGAVQRKIAGVKDAAK